MINYGRNVKVIYKMFFPTAKEYMFFSSAHGTFYMKYHVVGHKTGLNKFKLAKIIICIFFAIVE